VVLQLPLPFGPQGKTCLSYDVVGVALDGSLIRNNEHSLYQVFGSETLIGYALDGFPIYGLNKSSAARCLWWLVSFRQLPILPKRKQEGRTWLLLGFSCSGYRLCPPLFST
jgi:hypothetical protein